MAPENKRFLYIGAAVSLISGLLPIGNRLYAMGFMHTDLQRTPYWGEYDLRKCNEPLVMYSVELLLLILLPVLYSLYWRRYI